MFSSALKSLTSNITSNYSIAPQPSSTSGPWRIFDAKHRKTGKQYSVFIFDRKSLEISHGGLNSARNSSSSGLKRAQDEVLERLRKEASSLARLRHPSILELAEPIEETRNGGLMFATEAVTASLAGLLQEKDEQERNGRGTGKPSRYMVEEEDGTRRRRELEIDELEIQKGLLQLGKGLEFLHESAGLVHANLTPEAILVNIKGDWKISGFSLCSPHDSATGASSITPISLSELLNPDPRLPKTVQMNLDYTSPDFVLDKTLTASADMFSLGLIIVALYNSPHTSPLHASESISTYKRLFSSSSSVPTQQNNFLVPKSHPLPTKLATELLPRLITRRPANRLSASEFQQASYFDNILVSTIRFLDDLPAKTPAEKTQFMRGLPRVMPQFPKSVLEKKVLPALLEEMKDRELLAPILTNVFAMIRAMSSGKRTFAERVVPKLRETFLTKATNAAEKDTSKDAGLMVLLENMETIAGKCPGKEFREDILPILLVALESQTHGMVDAALNTLACVLPVLDYSTIKNELFPVIANVFAKTSSLNIKIRGLEAFYTLIGGSAASEQEARMADDLNGISVPDRRNSLSTASSSSILDKYTVQEKVVPLLKGIKTKEPGVMMAALKVFKQVGQVADTEFLAIEVLPILWSMSLGPLLTLQQFQAFMTLIKSIANKIEREQTRKLRELSASDGNTNARSSSARPAASSNGVSGPGLGNEETDFETLVSGRKAPTNGGNDDLMNSWDATATATARPAANRAKSSSRTNETPTLSWQASTGGRLPQTNTIQFQQQNADMRSVTPDQSLSSFTTLQPSSTQFSQVLQPTRSPPAVTSPSMSPSGIPLRPTQQQTPAFASNVAGSIDWSAATRPVSSSMASQGSAFGTKSSNSFSLPPPPTSPQNNSAFGRPPGPISGGGMGSLNNTASAQQTKPQKAGLDKYESLL